MLKTWKIGTDINVYVKKMISLSKYGDKLIINKKNNNNCAFKINDYLVEYNLSTSSQLIRTCLGLGIIETNDTFEKDGSVVLNKEYSIKKCNENETYYPIIVNHIIKRVRSLMDDMDENTIFPSEKNFLFSLLCVYLNKNEKKRNLLNNRIGINKIEEIEPYYGNIAQQLYAYTQQEKVELLEVASQYILGISESASKILESVDSEKSPLVIKIFDSKSNNSENVYSKSHTFGKFLSTYFIDDTRISVPIYQRKYVWPKLTVITFLNDINSLAINKTHYIGNITIRASHFSVSKKIFNIIDGQQRITTLCLITRALFDLCKLKKWKVDEFINEKLSIEHNGNAFTKIFIRIKGNSDYQSFQNVMKGNRDFAYSSESIITKNFKIIVDWFVGNLKNENEASAFWKKLINSVVFVLIEPKDINEHKLFEKLNTGSKSLTILELFKNFVLDSFERNEISNDENNEIRDEESQKKFEDYISSKFDDNGKRNEEKINTFVTTYLRLKNSKIGEDTLFNQFKEVIEQLYLLNNPNMELDEILKIIGDQVSLYKTISEFSEYNKGEGFTKYCKDFLYMFDGRSVYYPLIIKLIELCFQNYNTPSLEEANNFREFMRVLEIFEVRLQIANYRGQSLNNMIESLLSKIAIQTKNNQKITSNDLWLWIKDKYDVPTLESFKNRLESSKINNKPARIVLTRIENYFANPLRWKIDKSPIYFSLFEKNVEREHLLPKNWDKWKSYLLGRLTLINPSATESELKENVEKYVDYIGNAFPIPDWSNKIVGNETLEKKIEKFRNTSFYDKTITFSGIRDKLDPVGENFDIETIKKRSTQIAKIATEIWKDYSIN